MPASKPVSPPLQTHVQQIADSVAAVGRSRQLLQATKSIVSQSALRGSLRATYHGPERRQDDLADTNRR